MPHDTRGAKVEVGIGPLAAVPPATALAVGLKVDMDALPASVAAQAKAGQINLDDPGTTLALLSLNAVVGVKGTVSADGKRLQSIGVTCALCHSTVDDAFAPGIGHRLDGWANRDLNVGAIVALAPDLSPFTKTLGVDAATVKKVLASWGPGKFDAELNLDGKAFRPDGKSAATLIPPAFGMAGVNLHTWTAGHGTVSYWNAYVANLEMHGKGVFFDEHYDNAQQFPVSARTKQGHKRDAVDLISAKLPALHTYQLSLPAPKPPAGSFDAAAAARGKQLFLGKANCATVVVTALRSWSPATGRCSAMSKGGPPPWSKLITTLPSSRRRRRRNARAKLSSILWPMRFRSCAGWRMPTAGSSGTTTAGMSTPGPRRNSWKGGAGNPCTIPKLCQRCWSGGKPRSQRDSRSIWCFRSAAPMAYFGRF
jgi:hypothetical protein